MYTVIPTEQFEKDVKYYIKKKGFTHIFKVRSVNTDTKAGQSNGYRIIYYAVRDDAEVYLLTIYYKKDDNRIPTNQEIIELVETYCM